MARVIAIRMDHREIIGIPPVDAPAVIAAMLAILMVHRVEKNSVCEAGHLRLQVRPANPQSKILRQPQVFQGVQEFLHAQTALDRV
jgi:hypothetical protein